MEKYKFIFHALFSELSHSNKTYYSRILFFSVKYLKAFCVINFIVLYIALVLIHGIIKLSEYLEANKNICSSVRNFHKILFRVVDGRNKMWVEWRWGEQVRQSYADYRDLIIPRSTISIPTVPLPTLIKTKLIKTSFIQTTLI